MAGGSKLKKRRKTYETQQFQHRLTLIFDHIKLIWLFWKRRWSEEKTVKGTESEVRKKNCFSPLFHESDVGFCHTFLIVLLTHRLFFIIIIIFIPIRIAWLLTPFLFILLSSLLLATLLLSILTFLECSLLTQSTKNKT